MIRFINSGDAAFASLERQATGRCVVFPQQLMPPGATPNRARVGFEVSEADGTASLLVDRGIEYVGPNHDVRRWLLDGEMRFQSFERLRQWIQEDLKACYGLNPGPGPNPEAHRRSPVSATELTDLDAVMSQAATSDGTTHIDEDELLAHLSRRIRGQDDALRVMTRVICRHLSRRFPRRPATLMALGPTGVGKTASAEWLPHALRDLDLVGAGYGYLRLDMSEYQERHRISQLLGAPQGYIGYGDGAQLVDALVANSRTIVLFDEIEKAHPDILRALMNAMDAGRLSTSSPTAPGREVDCRGAIFIFTSNLDASGMLKEISDRDAFGSREVMEGVCRRRLRAAGVAPELVGRIGCFLVFRPLSAEARAEVITLSIARVADEYGLRLFKIAPGVVANILNACPADGFGARPDEYLVDEVLGACFAEAARSGITAPIALEGGPPYRCEPVQSEQASLMTFGSLEAHRP